MALTLPLFAQDQSYPPWMLRRFFDSQSNAGVGKPLIDYFVSPGAGLTVNVAGGDAYVLETVESTETSTADNGLYYVFNDGVVQPTNAITTPTTYTRVDQIVLRVYDVVEQALGGASRAEIQWVQGAETNGASLANLYGLGAAPANSLVLAYILQTVGASSISAANIMNIAQSFNGEVVSGDVIWNPGFTRAGAVPADGTAYNRRGYPGLFSAITSTFTATTTAASPTISAVPAATITALQKVTGGLTSGLAIPVSSPSFTGATTITAYNAGALTITLAANASTSSSASSITICPFGAGDGTSTFNVPNWAGRTLVGSGLGSNWTDTLGNSFAMTARVLGTNYGEEQHKLTAAEGSTNPNGSTNTTSTQANSTGTTSTQGNSTGSGTTGAMSGNDPHGHSLNINSAGSVNAVWGLPQEYNGISNAYATYNQSVAHTHTVPQLSIPALTVNSASIPALTVNSASLVSRAADNYHNNVQPSSVCNVWIKL